MPNKEKISVIIPCYNEEKIIGSTLKKVVDFFNQAAWPHEIIVVDDGSTDQTLKIAQSFGAKIVKNEVNRGKGYSVKAGSQVATGDWLLFFDADYSTPIEELDKVAVYFNNYDVIIGSRAISGAEVKKYQPWHKVIIGKIGNLIIRIVLGLNLSDTQCGFKLFNHRAKKNFDQQTIDRWGFDFELLYLAQKRGLKIKEVGVAWTDDPSSTVGIMDYFKTLSEVFKVKINDWRGKYQ